MKLLAALLCPILLTGCALSGGEPVLPNTQLTAKSCSIKYGDNVYSAHISNSYGSVTSIVFDSPQALYTFSDNGCSIVLDNLKFKTEKSFMSSSALPQIICDFFKSASNEASLVYNGKDENGSGIFTGKFGSADYKIISDFETGEIKLVSYKGMTINFNQ